MRRPCGGRLPTRQQRRLRPAHLRPAAPTGQPAARPASCLLIPRSRHLCPRWEVRTRRHPAENAATGTSPTGHDVRVPLTISVLADRPDLVGAMWNMPNSWPEFMRHDPIGGLFYNNVETRFAEYVLVAQ